MATKSVYVTDQVDASIHALAKQLVEIEKEGGKKKDLVKQIISLLEMKKIPKYKICSTIFKLCDGYVSERYIREIAKTIDAAYDSEPVPDSDSSTFQLRLDANSPQYLFRKRFIDIFSDIIELATTSRDIVNSDYDEIEEEDKETGEKVIIRKERNWNAFFSTWIQIWDKKRLRNTWFLKPDAPEDLQAFLDKLQETLPTMKLLNEYVNASTMSHKHFDKRVALLPGMLLPFLAKVTTTSVKYVSTKYYQQFKPMYDVTPKKGGQFLDSDSPFSDIIQGSLENGYALSFLDLNCPDCKKPMLKPTWKKDGTWCLVCRNSMDHKEPKEMPAELLKDRVQGLEYDFDGMATSYLRTNALPIDP